MSCTIVFPSWPPRAGPNHLLPVGLADVTGHMPAARPMAWKAAQAPRTVREQAQVLAPTHQGHGRRQSPEMQHHLHRAPSTACSRAAWPRGRVASPDRCRQTQQGTRRMCPLIESTTGGPLLLLVNAERGGRSTRQGGPASSFWCCYMFMSGGVLLSHTVPGAVPSALEGLTSGFGMGPGVSPPL
jgi:hypothetical protein